MTKVSMVDIYDKDGNLVRIETYKMDGEHFLDFLWDERDEQTSDNRLEFRKWVRRFLKQKDAEVAE